jgi:hypothetical protein
MNEISVYIMVELSDMTKTENELDTQQRHAFQDVLLKWKNFNGRQGMLGVAVSLLIKTLYGHVHPAPPLEYAPLFHPKTNDELRASKRFLKDAVYSFQAARLVSIYLDLQSAESKASMSSSLDNRLQRTTPETLQILKSNFKEEFKYLLASPKVSQLLKSDPRRIVSPPFLEGTSALFYRLDGLVCYLSRWIGKDD